MAFSMQHTSSFSRASWSVHSGEPISQQSVPCNCQDRTVSPASQPQRFFYTHVKCMAMPVRSDINHHVTTFTSNTAAAAAAAPSSPNHSFGTRMRCCPLLDHFWHLLST
jgi:hypothetical protein